MKRWFAPMVIAAAILSAAVSGFTSPQQEPVAGGGLPGDWGDINWHQFKGSKINVIAASIVWTRAMDSRIADFEALTGIGVSFENLSDSDRRKKQLLDYSSNMAEYDVGIVGFSQREEFAPYLANLRPLINDAKLTDLEWYNMDDYPKELIDAGTAFSGDLVFIPFTAEYYLLNYRVDLFDKLGFAAPPTSRPLTFSEVRSLAQKIDTARKSGTIKEYGWAERVAPAAALGGWSLFCSASRYDYNLIDFDKKVSYVNTPKGREMIGWFTSMVTDFAPSGSGNWAWPEVAQSFRTGELALIPGANGYYRILEDPKESQVAGKVGYAPPQMNPGGRDPLWTWGWAINKDSKKKEAAWLFIQWATSPPFVREMVPSEYGCPARSSIYKEQRYLDGMPAETIVRAQDYMLGKGINPRPPMIHKGYAEAGDIVAIEMNNVVAGIKTVEQAAADADKELVKLGYSPAR
jgi:multiple sugar transport system substrate-binding protein